MKINKGKEQNPDTDKDGLKDFEDTDSDNDGIPDSYEAGQNPEKNRKIPTMTVNRITEIQILIMTVFPTVKTRIRKYRCSS
jgi:hypothetical protein